MIKQLQPTCIIFFFEQLQQSPCLNQKTSTNIKLFQNPLQSLALLID
jgi:hypothetical protein